MRLTELADHIDGQLIGNDTEFSSVSTDTRTLQPGDLFVALQGPHFDGHHYLAQAVAQGAVAVMVNAATDIAQPQLVVADPLKGLGELGRLWAGQFAARKVAITGSCGKTTLKEMVAAILSCEGETLFTKGNLNNEIGVPLTLCRLGPQHQFAVIECGANHVGEIAYTTALVQPGVAVVNNVAPAHLEGFGSIERVAQAKAEIYQGLGADGIAVINLDDGFASVFLEKTAGRKQITFSLDDSGANVFAGAVQSSGPGLYAFDVHLPNERIRVQLPLPGLHNVRNALAACAIALALEVPASAMQQGLMQMRAVPGRLFPVTDLPRHQIIDDSYNANPASIRAAIDVLAEAGTDTCLVLGGMGELGDDSAQLHEQVGQYAAQKGITRVYSLGANAGFYRTGYEQQAPVNGRFVICESHQQIADALMREETDKTILVKGSRSTGMEKVIQALRDRYQLHEEKP